MAACCLGLQPELLMKSGDEGFVLFGQVPVAEYCCSIAADVAEPRCFVGGGSPDDVCYFFGFHHSIMARRNASPSPA